MTGVGKVLLANQSESAIEKYLAKPLLSATKNTIVDPDILRLALAEVREQGFAVAREEISIGTGSVAVPIFVKGDVLVAALGVVVHVARIDVPALVTMLRSAAETISLEIDPVRSFTKTKPELRQR
jgi:DNA-binding IclR family transcriptional regulator